MWSLDQLTQDVPAIRCRTVVNEHLGWGKFEIYLGGQ